MTKIKIGDLVTAHNNKSFDELVNLNLKAKDAFIIAKAIKLFGSEVESYLKVRDEKIKEYGEEIDGKIAISHTSDNFSKFIEEMNEVETTEVELDFTPLSIDVLGENEISAKTLVILNFMFA